MTRKHFRAMAENIRRQLDEDPTLRESLRYTAKAFAEFAATTNPRFDRVKFFRACGLE
jgi:hypothetical protein